jgi:hypothetical protein
MVNGQSRLLPETCCFVRSITSYIFQTLAYRRSRDLRENVVALHSLTVADKESAA